MSTEAPRRELDPRLNAFRPDLAAEQLRGLVDAENFVQGLKHQIARPVVPMRSQPDTGASITNEALFGESLWVYENKDGWSWCQLVRDDYVGYLPSALLRSQSKTPTHRVSAIGTFVFSKADIKSEPVMHLSINAQLSVMDFEGPFAKLEGGGFVTSRHISELNKFARDYVEVAERMIGVPYLWGGRTRVGIDCSGLVQVSMEAAGHICPRDSDMQRTMHGQDVLVPDDLSGLNRGDLVFWDGHVGVMADGMMLVHANAHHMAVVVEPLMTASDRIMKSGSRIAKILRPPKVSHTH